MCPPHFYPLNVHKLEKKNNSSEKRILCTSKTVIFFNTLNFRVIKIYPVAIQSFFFFFNFSPTGTLVFNYEMWRTGERRA